MGVLETIQATIGPGGVLLGSPRRQPRDPSTSECRFNKSPHHQSLAWLLERVQPTKLPGDSLALWGRRESQTPVMLDDGSPSPGAAGGALPFQASRQHIGMNQRELMDEALRFICSHESSQSEEASRKRVSTVPGGWEADLRRGGVKVRRITGVAQLPGAGRHDSWADAMSSSVGLNLHGLAGHVVTHTGLPGHAATHNATAEPGHGAAGFGFSQSGPATQRRLPPFCRTSLCEASVIEIFAERPARERESRDPSLSRRLAARYNVTAKAVRDIWNMR